MTVDQEIHSGASLIEAHQAAGLLPVNPDEQFVRQVHADYDRLVATAGETRFEPFIPPSFLVDSLPALLRVFDPVLPENLHSSRTFVFTNIWGYYDQKDLLLVGDHLVEGMLVGSEVEPFESDGLYLTGQTTEQEQLRTQVFMQEAMRQNPAIVIEVLDPGAFVSLGGLRQVTGRSGLAGFTHFPQLDNVHVTTMDDPVRKYHTEADYRPYVTGDSGHMTFGGRPVEGVVNNQAGVRFKIRPASKN